MTEEQYPRIYLYRRIVQAKIFIDNQYAKRIDLNGISDEAFFSKFHFIRLFKEIYGKTPHQYLISVRIKNAMLLLQANEPVSDVCYAVGFESLSSFSALFKRITGATPSAYLNGQQKLKALRAASPLRFIPACIAEKNGWLKNSHGLHGLRG